jgi:hypothetical protein
MRTADAISFFGNKCRLADAIGYTRQAIYNWGEYPPINAQLRIEKAAKGALTMTKPKITWPPRKA